MQKVIKRNEIVFVQKLGSGQGNLINSMMSHNSSRNRPRLHILLHTEVVILHNQTLRNAKVCFRINPTGSILIEGQEPFLIRNYTVKSLRLIILLSEATSHRTGILNS